MKKLLLVLVLLLGLSACGQKTSENSIGALVEEGYTVDCSTFDEERWKGLLNCDGKYYVVTANLTSAQYDEANEVFFEDDKYQEFIKGLEVASIEDITDRIPSLDDLQVYVGKTLGEIEDEGFENMGYCQSNDTQYNFTYENDTFCMSVKNSLDTPIDDLDNFSANDLRELVVCEIVDVYVSSNILYEE